MTNFDKPGDPLWWKYPSIWRRIDAATEALTDAEWRGDDATADLLRRELEILIEKERVRDWFDPPF